MEGWDERWRARLMNQQLNVDAWVFWAAEAEEKRERRVED
jgi:hypothetical protein